MTTARRRSSLRCSPWSLWITHRGNIARLSKGTEGKIGASAADQRVAEGQKNCMTATARVSPTSNDATGCASSAARMSETMFRQSPLGRYLRATGLPALRRPRRLRLPRPERALRFRCRACDKDFTHHVGNAVRFTQATAARLSRGHRDLLQRGEGQEHAGDEPRSGPSYKTAFVLATRCARRWPKN